MGARVLDLGQRSYGKQGFRLRAKVSGKQGFRFEAKVIHNLNPFSPQLYAIIQLLSPFT
jgi:hypothetical protein